MTLGQRLWLHPQSLWLRKALFQIHLWTGIGVGLYVLVVCVSGSVLVFRNELYRIFTMPPKIVKSSGERMTPEELKKSVQQAYPGYELSSVFQGRTPDQAVEVWLERGTRKKQRLFDPYTGQDLGDSIPHGIRIISWLLDLHDNLLYGMRGRAVNGIGGLFLTLLSVTGAIIWWPGMKNWRRSLSIEWRAHWKRLNWDLHSAMGFWTVLFVFMWGVSGIYLAFPTPFQEVVDFLQPMEQVRNPRVGDEVLRWLARLHFGRFAGWPFKVLWIVIGLAPVFLFVTGALMWWNRVLRRSSR
jgi:uncharacterized iron-regulated membrane protein